MQTDAQIPRELEAATAGHRPRQRRFRPSIKNRETGDLQPNDVRINLGGRTRESGPQYAEASWRSVPAATTISIIKKKGGEAWEVNPTQFCNPSALATLKASSGTFHF